MNRQSGAPMEGRAVLAYRDHRLDEIVVYASTQTPHTVRRRDRRGARPRAAPHLRVVAPDVGGGFGPKARLYPGGDHPGGAGARARPSGALDRGPQRAPADLRPYPRSPLQGDRLRRRSAGKSSASTPRSSSMPAPMASGRRARTRRPTWRRVPCPGHNMENYRARLHGRDQQGAARPLSRGRPPRRLLCDRAHDRRGGARRRPRPGRGAHREHDPEGRRCRTPRSPDIATTPATTRPASGSAPNW